MRVGDTVTYYGEHHTVVTVEEQPGLETWVELEDRAGKRYWVAEGELEGE